jgi:hypothetical protein
MSVVKSGLPQERREEISQRITYFLLYFDCLSEEGFLMASFEVRVV